MPKSSGLRGGRSRNPGSGRARAKRGDTQMRTIERIYGRDFNVRGDMRLDTYLDRVGVASLNDVITGR